MSKLILAGSCRFSTTCSKIILCIILKIGYNVIMCQNFIIFFMSMHTDYYTGWWDWNFLQYFHLFNYIQKVILEEVNELALLLIEIGYVAERLRYVKMNKHGRMVLVINFQLIYLNKSKIQLDRSSWLAAYSRNS